MRLLADCPLVNYASVSSDPFVFLMSVFCICARSGISCSQSGFALAGRAEQLISDFLAAGLCLDRCTAPTVSAGVTRPGLVLMFLSPLCAFLPSQDLCWSMSRRVDLESAKIDQRKKERREVKDEPVSAVYERFLAPAR